MEQLVITARGTIFSTLRNIADKRNFLSNKNNQKDSRPIHQQKDGRRINNLPSFIILNILKKGNNKLETTLPMGPELYLEIYN